jgi:hypothetical protein
MGGLVPDRIIRDELLESDRWLDLPTDASRLAFVGFLLVCDDFGNFEGGPRRLFRLLHKFTQIKTEEASVAVLDALMACDLIRRYESDKRELFHIPRFKSHRQYLSRLYPPSPWCPKDTTLGKEKRIINKGLAKNVVTTSLQRSNDVAEGVGVGVGVGVGKIKNNNKAQAPFVLPEWVPQNQWNAWIEARTKRRNAPTEWAKKLAVRRLEDLKERGHSPALVLAESAFNGWAGLFEPKGNK